MDSAWDEHPPPYQRHAEEPPPYPSRPEESFAGLQPPAGDPVAEATRPWLQRGKLSSRMKGKASIATRSAGNAMELAANAVVAVPNEQALRMALVMSRAFSTLEIQLEQDAASESRPPMVFAIKNLLDAFEDLPLGTA